MSHACKPAAAGGGGAGGNAGGGGSAGGGFSPIASFVRIKPLAADPGGGTASAKSISAWDEETGTIEMDTGGGKVKTFDFPTATLLPESTQAQVYSTVAAPLVAQFCQGFDVDLISYGQTGSGKTYTMFGPPHSMAAAAAALPKDSGTGKPGGGGGGGGAVLLPEHGVVLRAGLECLAGVAALEARGCKAALHGSMVEMAIHSFQDQNCKDLLNGMAVCFVDDAHHLQGAGQMELRCAADVVRLAAAVETRLTRGTKMNDTSSRSHCVAVLKLTVREADAVRVSRLQFFDLMGSERFTGQNAAHDTAKSSKATTSGWEGIFSNLSLMSLYSCIELAAKHRRKKKTPGSGSADKALLGMLLTNMLAGSLHGAALTGMITCVSQSPRNGDESYLSLKYGTTMSKLLNKATPQPALAIRKQLAKAEKMHAEAAAVVARGVQGKYQAQRQAQVSAYSHTVAVLRELLA